MAQGFDAGCEQMWAQEILSLRYGSICAREDNAMAEQSVIEEFSREDRIAAKQGRGDAFHLTTHKARSIWYRDNAAWPTLEASVQRLVSERRRVRRTLQTAPGAGTWEAVGPTNIGGRMTAIVCHPQHAEVIWAGAAGGGVWHSTDAGQ